MRGLTQELRATIVQIPLHIAVSLLISQRLHIRQHHVLDSGEQRKPPPNP